MANQKLSDMKQAKLANALLSMTDLNPEELDVDPVSMFIPEKQWGSRAFQIDYPTKHGTLTKYVFIGPKGAVKWNFTEIYTGSKDIPVEMMAALHQRAWGA